MIGAIRSKSKSKTLSSPYQLVGLNMSRFEIPEEAPRLYGLNDSNRDFLLPSSWGKNQFNNAFPVALAHYMHDKGMGFTYLAMDQTGSLVHSRITLPELFGAELAGIQHSFEHKYNLYADLCAVPSALPRIDLVLSSPMGQTRALEIKLTVLPDHTTAWLSEDRYGSELVIRPDTIVYQALSIASRYREARPRLMSILSPAHSKVSNWHSSETVFESFEMVQEALRGVVRDSMENQQPLLMQPIWKTVGTTLRLADHALDIFVWSDIALTELFLKEAPVRLGRNERTTVWLFLMLHEFAATGKIDHHRVLGQHAYDTKNDKAFAVSGQHTNPLMASESLTQPRIRKDEIPNIILGGGHSHLMPERRLDATIQSDRSIFPFIEG